MEDGYSESLSSLVKATIEDMAKYHVDEAPRIVASIAQRVSIKQKIELSIAYVVLASFYSFFLMCSVVVSGTKVRPHQRGHSASDGHHRILENAPEERRPWWLHVEEMLAGHP